MGVPFDDIILYSRCLICFLCIFSRREVFNWHRIIQISTGLFFICLLELAKNKKWPCPCFHSLSSQLDWSNTRSSQWLLSTHPASCFNLLLFNEVHWFSIVKAIYTQYRKYRKKCKQARAITCSLNIPIFCKQRLFLLLNNVMMTSNTIFYSLLLSSLSILPRTVSYPYLQSSVQQFLSQIIVLMLCHKKFMPSLAVPLQDSIPYSVKTFVLPLSLSPALGNSKENKNQWLRGISTSG